MLPGKYRIILRTERLIVAGHTEARQPSLNIKVAGFGGIPQLRRFVVHDPVVFRLLLRHIFFGLGNGFNCISISGGGISHDFCAAANMGSAEIFFNGFRSSFARMNIPKIRSSARWTYANGFQFLFGIGLNLFSPFVGGIQCRSRAAPVVSPIALR